MEPLSREEFLSNFHFYNNAAGAAFVLTQPTKVGVFGDRLIMRSQNELEVDPIMWFNVFWPPFS